MGFSSQEGQVGFALQGAEGAFTAATQFMRTRSGSIGPNRDLLIPDPEIGGNRDVPDAYLGAISFSGEYEFYARLKSLALLLQAVCGDAGPPITPIDGAPLPWISVEENVAGSFETFNFFDAKANTLHLEAEANGYLMGTVGIIARNGVAGATKTDLVAQAALVDTTPMIVGTNITVDYNGVQLPAKSFSLDINNNMEDDDFRLGSFFLGDVTEKRRELTMGVTIRPEDSALWRQATYGVPAATQPGGLTTKQPAVITAETYEGGGLTGTFVATVNNAVFVPFAVDPSGDDVLEFDFEVRGIRPTPATPIVSFAVTPDA